MLSGCVLYSTEVPKTFCHNSLGPSPLIEKVPTCRTTKPSDCRPVAAWVIRSGEGMNCCTLSDVNRASVANIDRSAGGTASK
jgi:hypothetical protein